MDCPKCNAQIRDEVLFCTQCGHPSRVIITVSFRALPNGDKVTGSFTQVAPEPRAEGESVDFQKYEVLDFLRKRGVSDADSERFLEELVWRRPAGQSLQFKLSKAEEKEVRSFFIPGV